MQGESEAYDKVAQERILESGDIVATLRSHSVLHDEGIRASK